jgi:hypothetical protein
MRDGKREARCQRQDVGSRKMDARIEEQKMTAGNSEKR